MGEKIHAGGMGVILSARDEDLRRDLAMKVVKDSRRGDPGMTVRVVEEAQVTAQLTHPGVVPVHELGVDADGNVYFTMARVEGHDLEEIFARARRGVDKWTRERLLDALLRVCDTMAYAHARGVIHRDLKPANVMVGAFGEVYVMDWGLAKIVGETESSRSLPPESRRAVTSDRADAITSDVSDSLATMDGAALGTPGYMSPEQALGAELDERSDVYSVGAMLYALLAGRAPYAGLGPQQAVLAVTKEPPAPLAKLAPDAPPELVAICEKAMSRERGERYPDMRGMAEDLRAFLEHRVVRAYRTGPWVELVKWVARNRRLAASLALLALAIAVSAIVIVRQRERAQRRELLLADTHTAASLSQRADELWPALPVNTSDFEFWTSQLHALEARRPEHAALLAELASDPEETAKTTSLHRMNDVDLPSAERSAESIEARKRVAQSVRERTIDGPEAKRRWSDAASAIASDPKYGGLVVKPQIGLLPLERDPGSGLWEFWHTLSGDEPRRDPATKRWDIRPETGIVLVLLPAATTRMGSLAFPNLPSMNDWSEAWAKAQELSEWGEPWYCPGVEDNEHLTDEFHLDAFFLSKYEMTQAQWMRVAANTSQYSADSPPLVDGPTHEHWSATMPVEGMSWDAAVKMLGRLALELPTEAQWEYACRAGTRSPFHTGWTLESLQGYANVRDETYLRFDPSDPFAGTKIDDGVVRLARVGSYLPNAFGLHDMHGNVWEWVRDVYSPKASPRSGDGLTPSATDDGVRTFRGGAYSNGGFQARASKRFAGYMRSNTDGDLGVRPARALER